MMMIDDCVPGAFCEITNEADQNKIYDQLHSIDDYIVSQLEADGIVFYDPNPYSRYFGG